MAKSTESSSADNAPMLRPRPRYFDPNRYASGSGASSPASSSSLSPPNPPYITSPPRTESFASSGSLSGLDSPFLGAGRPLSLGYEYAFPADPSSWSCDLTPDIKEADDELHDPQYDFMPDSPITKNRESAGSTLPFFRRSRISTIDEGVVSDSPSPVPDGSMPEKSPAVDDAFWERRHRRFRVERTGGLWSWRALINLGSLLVITFGLVFFFAGFPIFVHFMGSEPSTLGAFNLGGINASGQVPQLVGRFTLVDPDTPQSALTIASPHDSSQQLELVFSDEFNTPGRSFYPGDDPFWEAVDLHYWATNNLEWYDPAAVTTTPDGSLTITLSEKQTHDLNYQGGLLSTWNKFCFTGGYVVANVSLPGVSNIQGLWPAIWMMGNLGRAGYGATLEGLWPYSYDSCDVGTVANQSINGLPQAATVNGDQGKGGVLSYLPGQRLSRCTCKDAPDGEKGSRLDHPGPKHSDGTWVGRAAPEIDVFEAQVTTSSPSHPGILTGQVSQSAQWAPFNAGYIWDNATNEIISNPLVSVQNTFIGSATQQATSVVTDTNPQCYQYPDPALVPPPSAAQSAQSIPGSPSGCFDIYGVEYEPGFDDAYIQWVSSSKPSWTLSVAGLGADAATQISARPVPQEPMYLIANLGMSFNFGAIDLAAIPFPVMMKIDWIRVYQRPDAKNVGCDPEGFPTAEYIERYSEAYTNPNLTTWRGDFGQVWPGNSWLGQCGSS